MRELINFSVYDSDTARFDHNWQFVAEYAHNHGLAGLELLIGFEPPPNGLPAGLVQAVHLPFWITWLDVWQARPGAVERYFADVDRRYLDYYCGGATPVEIVATSRRVWQYAAQLQPNYAVFHVSHIEPEHSFSRPFPYSNLDIINASADLLNAVAATFEGGEPPVRLFLENLWWPGLTFTSNAAAEHLAARLNFSNWAFVLDTGHLMNTNPNLDNEDAAIDFVLATLGNLSPAVRQRIEGVHFNLSTSGAYQREYLKNGPPAGYDRWPSGQKIEYGWLHAYNIDQHRPFTSLRCREIVAAIQPQFLTHEFLSANQAEFTAKLTTQQAALG